MLGRELEGRERAGREREKKKEMFGSDVSGILDQESFGLSNENDPRFVANDILLNKEIPGLRNTYEPLFFSQIKYLSDSQGWYEECMCKIFKKSMYPKIQLLTHSYLWDQNPEKDFTYT